MVQVGRGIRDYGMMEKEPPAVSRPALQNETAPVLVCVAREFDVWLMIWVFKQRGTGALLIPAQWGFRVELPSLQTTVYLMVNYHQPHFPFGWGLEHQHPAAYDGKSGREGAYAGSTHLEISN